MDHKAAAAYREWRQAFGQPDGEKHRTEFRELDRKLQQTLAGFCYQTKVIQEMTATAQNIAARFQASLRVIQHAQRCRDSLSQMPLVDVERQTIEGMEEFVRMPGEMFLRNCAQLKTAETRFQQARCELIHGHLHLVAPIAETYSHRGLTPPELIREGIFGLVRAVEKFGCRHEWRFSTYAACWIRQNIRDALAAQASPGGRTPAPATGQSHTSAGNPQEESLLKDQ
jgi:DNA-directed RNA polymerase sigma subunit (sigma70/sigma32)